MVLRWGIVSSGAISNDFCLALATLPSFDHQIVAVAARDGDRAKEFAKLHDIPKSYGSYEELAKDPNVNIAYIGTIHPTHYELSILMLTHGKHVLCEKPLCMNKNQVEKLIHCSKEKNLFLMEAVWSRYLPSYQYLKQQITSNVLGEIQEIDVTFGFELSEVDRLTKKSLGGGAVLDLGIYTIQISQWVFNENPTNIKATGKLNDEGIDTSFEAVLTYSNSGITKMKVSSTELLENKAIIKGKKGSIILHDFWSSPYLTDIDGNEKRWEFPKPNRKPNFINSTALRYEAEEARKCIQNNKLESEYMNHKESLLLAEIEDEIREQIGVKYDVDDE